MSLDLFLRERRDQILGIWEGEARAAAVALGREHPALLEDMPRLLEDFAQILGGDERSADALAQDSAAKALENGYPLSQIVHELGLFRRCVLRSWLSQDPSALLADGASAASELDRVVELAIDQYLEARTHLLDAFERIVASALSPADLDRFLRELLAILVGLAPTVDALAILLRDRDRLVVRASVGPDLPESLGFSLGIGEGFAGAVASSKQAMAARMGTEAAPARGLPFFGAATRGLFGVPLLEGGEIIGVALAASTVRDEIPLPERRLFALGAQRATAAIVHHQFCTDAIRRTAELDAFIEAIPSPVYLGTAERFVNANRAGLALFDLASKDDLAKVSARELVERAELHDPSTGARVPPEESAFMRALRGERVARDFLARDHRTGEQRCFRSVSGPVIVDGQASGAVLVTSDITDRKWAEERFRIIFERVPMAMAQSDPQTGKLVRANAKMCELTGYSVDEMVGHSFAEWTHPDDRARNLAEYARMARGEVDVYTTEKRYLRKDGSERWVRVTANLLPSPGEPARTLATIEDITERKRAELEREGLLAREHAARADAERAQEDLRRTAEFRERLIGIVSHDLGNPLSAIMTGATYLSRAEDLPDRLAKSAARIGSAADRMHRIIGQLLDFTRGRLGGGIAIERRPTDVGAIVRRVLDELEASHPARQLVLTASGSFAGEYDEIRLAQVVSNLVGNALENSPPDSPVTVSLAERSESDIVLEVKNRGAPIAPELLPHIFEPFRRGRVDRGTSGGLGLGLFITAEIVRAHGGTIHVASTAADGTTFTVVLPRSNSIPNSGGSP
jgi:PAS domain S-box-containing protein